MREHKRQTVKLPSWKRPVKVFQAICEAFDTPTSLSCWLLTEYGEWDQLVVKEALPDAYLDPAAFWKDNVTTTLLRKASFLPTTFNRRETAKKRFWDAEEMCKDSNRRLSLYSNGAIMPADRRVHGVLHRTRELIARILGPLPAEFEGGRFGPGVTSLVKRDVTLAQKYASHVDVTPRLYSCWRDVAGPVWAPLITSVRLMASNKVTFVPKNAKTERSIAVEPHLNIYAQLGVGGLIRARLRKFGLNLETQAEFNRFLASIAEEARLCTIDLSMASDTLCRELVWLLLPEEWADLLDKIRSPYGDLDGVEFEYAKFSSMGNGCTFELETLIFYAICLASGSSRALTSAFGDDLVVEQEVADTVVATLNFVGFEVNTDKTFLSGSFYESCGEDYFQGANVRGVYWKQWDLATAFKVCNDVARIAQRWCPEGTLDSRFLPSWLKAIDSVPQGYRVGIPWGIGDVGIVSNQHEPPASVQCSPFPDKYGWDGLWHKAIGFTSRRVNVSDSCGAWLASLDGFRSERKPGDPAGYHPIRGQGKYEVKRQFSRGNWRNLGVWC